MCTVGLDGHRRNFRGAAFEPQLFGVGDGTPTVSTPSQKFCLVPHLSDQSYATVYGVFLSARPNDSREANVEL